MRCITQRTVHCDAGGGALGREQTSDAAGTLPPPSPALQPCAPSLSPSPKPQPQPQAPALAQAAALASVLASASASESLLTRASPPPGCDHRQGREAPGGREGRRVRQVLHEGAPPAARRPPPAARRPPAAARAVTARLPLASRPRAVLLRAAMTAPACFGVAGDDQGRQGRRVRLEGGDAPDEDDGRRLGQGRQEDAVRPPPEHALVVRVDCPAPRQHAHAGVRGPAASLSTWTPLGTECTQSALYCVESPSRVRPRQCASQNRLFLAPSPALVVVRRSTWYRVGFACSLLPTAQHEA